MAKTQLGPVSERIYARILREIETGEFPPDSRLPTENQLCARFSASRTAVRKALRRLIDEKRVVSRQGSGTYVRTPPKALDRANIVSIMYAGDLSGLARLQERALRQGFTLGLYSQSRGNWSRSQEAAFLRNVMLQRHKALLAFCSPLGPTNDGLLRDLDRSGVRVIHFEPYAESLPEQNYLMADYHRAGAMGAVALMLAGYERILFCGMSNDGPYGLLQEAGFREALHDQFGLPLDRRPFT